MEQIAIPLILIVAIALFFVGLARTLTAPSEEIDARLERYGTRDNELLASFQRAATSSKDKGERRSSFISRWLEKRAASKDNKKASALRDDLARADLKMKVSEWQTLQMGAVVLGVLLGFLIFRTWALAPLVGVLGFFVPRFYLHHRQRSRLKKFGNMLSDSIVMMANSLRAGYSFLQSLEVLTQEMPEPISGEFQRVIREVGLGRTQQEAMANLLRRMPSEDLDMMISAVNVQQEVGGNLAEILDILAHTIRERVRIQGEIRTLTAQQMLSGYVITFLPGALAVGLFLMNPDYMSNLYKTQCGWIMVAAAILTTGLGFLAIRKIIAIEV